VLAQKHFAAEPLTAVPGAISALTHSVIGSGLATLWRQTGRSPADETEQQPADDHSTPSTRS